MDKNEMPEWATNHLEGICDLSFVDLDVLRCAVTTRLEVSRDVLAYSHYDLSKYYSFMADNLVVRLIANVAGQQITLPAVRYPRDWKEAVKERFAPVWFLRRWPVQYTKKVFDVRVVYPMIALPRERHNIVATIVGI